MSLRGASWRLIVLSLAFCGPHMVCAAEPPGAIDFNRDIRPILSKACYNCHGPDDGHRKAGLRLDQRSAAISELETGTTAIVGGKPDESEVYARITSSDPDERMPPKSTGHQLTTEQIETIRKWIEQGAPYAAHWSFIKPERPDLPVVGDGAWPRNAIDRFVLARLESAGLRPQAEADRHTLIRRLSLDLRGLPPTPAEVQAFVADSRDDAYERLVDRFLGDSAYGERWARMWLDLARYADSKGYGFDALRTIWRYRDWVIDAFNRNLPLDRFTRQQLAGDLLENPTLDQKIATAFHRNTLTNVEGVEDEESRVTAVRDRLDTTFQVWMGLTMGCAKCHNHKFDPISQAEYYQGYALFNQTADSDQPDEAPILPAPPPELVPRLQALDAQIARARSELAVPDAQLAGEQLEWETAARVPVEWTLLEPHDLASESGAKLTVRDDGSIFVEGEPPAPNDAYTLVARMRSGGITALRLEAIPDTAFPNGGSGRSPEGNFILSKITAEVARDDEECESESSGKDDKASPKRTVELVQAAADFSQAQFPVAHAIEQPDLKKGGWGINPDVQKPHTAYFIAKPFADPDQATLVTIRLEHRYLMPRHALGRFRLAVTNTSTAAQRAPTPAEILAIVDLESVQRTDEQRTKLAAYFRTVAPSLAPLRARIAEIEQQRPPVPTVPVMVELPPERRRTTKIMLKGNHMTPGDTVEPGLPASFHPFSQKAPPNRLGLADWLMDRQNPLTARVAVNRFWAQLFGAGLVETEEDFGTQGDLPSHPELLDWLAVEFMEPSSTSALHGGGGAAWDIKRLLRLIVMSATYRQSPQATPDRLEKDSRNRLLSRGPRFRLEAEMVRDQALSLAGLLSRKSHGPSVFPPQPAGVWNVAFTFDNKWATSTGEDRYRRGLYTFWRRSAPYPSMVTFDATSRELCTMRRIRTNTPLQAFVTLNDPVYVEAAQALARRIVREGGGTTNTRAQYGLELCLVRPATKEQVDQIVRLYADEFVACLQDPSAAVKLATDPLGPLPAEMDVAELAAWTTVANVLLNLDGVLMKN